MVERKSANLRCPFSPIPIFFNTPLKIFNRRSAVRGTEGSGALALVPFHAAEGPRAIGGLRNVGAKQDKSAAETDGFDPLLPKQSPAHLQPEEMIVGEPGERERDRGEP